MIVRDQNSVLLVAAYLIENGLVAFMFRSPPKLLVVLAVLPGSTAAKRYRCRWSHTSHLHLVDKRISLLAQAFSFRGLGPLYDAGAWGEVASRAV